MDDEELYLGTKEVDQFQSWLKKNVKKTGEWYKDASADQAGIGDDILRLLGGGAKNVATVAGAVYEAPVLKQGFQALDALSYYGGKVGGEAAKAVGVDPRIGGAIGNVLGEVATGFGAKAGLKYGAKAAKATKNYAGAFYGLASGTAMGTGAHGATGLISKAIPTQSLAQLGRTEAGKAYKKLGRDWRASHPNLIGFTDSTKPFYDSAGNQVILRPAATKTDPFAVKLAYVADRKNAGLTRGASEWRMTPTDKQTWSKTLGEGFHDPKKLNLDQHHRHMVKGYDWGFDGLSRAEGQQLSKMLFEDGHALGRVNYNKLNLPKPVHDKLHAWMDGQLGLNGLNMKSLKGMDIQTRYKHLSIYLENIQPAIDEAVFELMRRYKAKESLFIPGVPLADQFTDARSGLKIGKKAKPTQFPDNIQRHIQRSQEIGITEPQWKSGSIDYTWRPQSGTGQIDIPPQSAKGFKGLRDEFFEQIEELPSGSVWELNPKFKDEQRRRIYARLFGKDKRITRNPDPTLGWVLTVP